MRFPRLAGEVAAGTRTLYIFIESFTVVFVETRIFNLRENGLALLVRALPRALCYASSSFNTRVQGQFFGVAIAYAVFVPYAIRILKPKFARGIQSGYHLYVSACQGETAL